MRPFQLVLALPLLACSSTLPRPEAQPHPDEHYRIVPYPPPSALVEIVPTAPSADAVWIDGYWDFRGRYYVWERGGWIAPQDGAYVCKWHARYEQDGTLLYAPTTWHDEDGNPIEPPPFLVPAATPPSEQTAEPTTIP